MMGMLDTSGACYNGLDMKGTIDYTMNVYGGSERCKWSNANIQMNGQKQSSNPHVQTLNKHKNTKRLWTLHVPAKLCHSRVFDVYIFGIIN